MRACRTGGMNLGRRAAIVAGWTWLVLGAPARPVGAAQEPGPAASTADEPGPAVATDLITRYRLIEHYSAKGEPGTVGPYRVAFRESETGIDEVAQGAPRRSERTAQAIYTERPVQVGLDDERRVIDLVRRYETVRATPDPLTKVVGHHPLDGLTIWYHARSNNAPLILSLTPGRRLLEVECQFASDKVFTPNLAYVLPEFPRRIGESWSIPHTGAEDLIGQTISGGALTGKLSAIRIEPTGTGRVAVIDVSGRLATQAGDTSVRAQLLFAFDAPTPGEKGEGKGKDEGDTVEVRGAIVKVSLGQSSTAVDVGPARGGQRLKRQLKRELVLERRLGAEGAALDAPATPPEPTEENSWLTYVDPKGRFTFHHPQDLLLLEGGSLDVLHLGHQQEGGGDLVELTFLPGERIRPDDFFKARAQQRRKFGLEVTPGATRALTGWPETMRTMRAEAAARPPSGGSGGTLYYFDYAIQFSQNASLTVGSTTTGESPSAFRDGIEAMLRTFRLGPPEEAKR